MRILLLLHFKVNGKQRAFFIHVSSKPGPSNVTRDTAPRFAKQFLNPTWKDLTILLTKKAQVLNSESSSLQGRLRKAVCSTLVRCSTPFSALFLRGCWDSFLHGMKAVCF